MSLYAKQVTSLHEAIVRRDSNDVLALIKTARHNEFPPQERVGVYAEGYLIRLVEATLSDYPTLSHYMGKDALEAAVTKYVQSSPSTFWDLNIYTVGLVDFMRSYSMDASVHTLTALESAITEIFWSQESTALTAAHLEGVDEGMLGDMHFFLRESSQLLELEKAANAYLTAFREDRPLDTVPDSKEYIFVIRHNHSVKRHILEPQEYQILSLLAAGHSFDAALSGIEHTDELAEKLPGYLGKWLENGMFSAETIA